MNLEDKVREVIIDELRRQAEAGGLRVDSNESEMMTIEGRVNLDELTMAIVGSMAGGP